MMGRTRIGKVAALKAEAATAPGVAEDAPMASAKRAAR
jgi:hypothetical protein